MEKKDRIPEQKVAISRKKIVGELPIVVNEITDKCHYSGFFGTLDSSRIKAITDKVLDLMTSTGIEIQGIKLIPIRPEKQEVLLSKPVTIIFEDERDTVQIRDIASEIACSMDFDKTSCAETALAVSEIVGNAVKFAVRSKKC